MAIRKYGYRRKRILRRPRRVMRRSNVRRRRIVRSMPKPEMKTQIYSPNTLTFNQYISATGDCLRLIPSISQSTIGSGRVGDSINLCSLNVRGVITLGSLDYATEANCRIGVRVMVLRAKRYADWNIASSNFATDSYKLLEGNTQFTGYLYDFTTPINRDFFSVIKDKRFYLSRSHSNSGTIDYMLDKSYAAFNWNLKYHKRKLRYHDSTNGATDPVNYPYFMCIAYTKLNGDSPALSGTTGINLQYTTTAKFTDY